MYTAVVDRLGKSEHCRVYVRVRVIVRLKATLGMRSLLVVVSKPIKL